jgi:hypothetical protein
VRYLVSLVLGGLALALTAATALGVVATPLSPAAGEVVALTPPTGFANIDHSLTWSITYDCPGGASIHSSYAQRRPVGTTDWQSQTRDGPFLGDGQFSTPSSFFPVAVPAAWEWRVFWACGATIGFAGRQDVSAAVPFTVVLAGAATTPATTPTPVTPQPAPVTAPCANLTGWAKALCRAKRTRATRLAACAKIGKAKRRAACRVRARARFVRTLRLHACAARTGKKRAACIRRANVAYRRAVT